MIANLESGVSFPAFLSASTVIMISSLVSGSSGCGEVGTLRTGLRDGQYEKDRRQAMIVRAEIRNKVIRPFTFMLLLLIRNLVADVCVARPAWHFDHLENPFRWLRCKIRQIGCFLPTTDTSLRITLQ